MKFFLLILLTVFHINTNILASPPKGGIGDGYIYPVKQTALKPKTTTTYYAKPLHTPMKKPSGPPKPKPEVFKIIIEDQVVPETQIPKQEQVFKVIRLPADGNRRESGKSVKILKIFYMTQTKGGKNRGWPK